MVLSPGLLLLPLLLEESKAALPWEFLLLSYFMYTLLLRVKTRRSGMATVDAGRQRAADTARRRVVEAIMVACCCEQ